MSSVFAFCSIDDGLDKKKIIKNSIKKKQCLAELIFVICSILTSRALYSGQDCGVTSVINVQFIHLRRVVIDDRS